MATGKRQAENGYADPILEKGLPASLDAERLVLGTLMRDGSRFDEVRATLRPEDFSLEKHRRIFLSMDRLRADGLTLDRISVAQDLADQNLLESCDGIGYLVSLDEGLPELKDITGLLRSIQEKSHLRKTIFASQKLIDRCLDNEKPRELTGAAEEVLMALGTDQQDDGPALPSQIIESFPGGVNAFLDPGSRQKGIETGFRRLDEMTGGFRPGELIIIAARPSQGKTSLALNIAQHVSLKGQKTVMFFSLEMSKQSLLTRMVCAEARVDQHRFRLGYLDADERRKLQTATARVYDARVFVDDKSAVTIPDVHARLRRRMASEPVHLVVIDYLQLMRGVGKQESRTQEVTEISRSLKLIAADLAVPIVALSQLSRAPELRKGNARPQLSDLRESGSIEQDSDVVMFIFREELYKPDREDLRGQAELLISKQREGPTGKINLVFLHHLTKFENRASDIEDETVLPQCRRGPDD